MAFLNRNLLAVVVCLPAALGAGKPADWVPARWQGGPLEIARRTKEKTLPPGDAVRQAIERWYDPSTLSLLEGTPVNCLLATWSIGADAEIEQRQQQLVKAYAREAHLRGMAILGLVYPGADAARFVAPAAEAELDGLLLEGEFPGGELFVRQVEKALQARNHAAVVAPLTKEPGPLRKADWPILATAGSWPRSRLLTEMGIRAAPSSEPWLDSNIWLLRSFRAREEHHPIWLGHLPATTRVDDYARAVADAAIAGGRWIISLDDGLRAALLARQPAALDTWRRIAEYLKFYQQHSAWGGLPPFGLLGIVFDRSGGNLELSEEYLNLIARRQIPYRVIDRADLGEAALTGLTATLVTDLAPPTEAERKLLRAFAERGGLVVAGRAWGGDVPKDKTFVELPAGKGRIAVYQDDQPDAEAVSKDMLDLMGEKHLGVRVFNMPSVLTYVSQESAGRRLLVQLLNYSSYPADSMTLRVTGAFQTARLFTPESGVQDLAVEKAGSATEISIPKLAIAGALLLE